MICVSISSVRRFHDAVKLGADLVELRLDLMRADLDELGSVLGAGMKTIVTCRPDGRVEQERIDLLMQCLDLGASMVDLEIESPGTSKRFMMEHARRLGREVIFSYHNFESTPSREELTGTMESIYDTGGHIAKIATMVQGQDDTRTLLSLYDQPGRKVVIGMGREGRITRVLAPYLGAEFTFASLEEDSSTAPGQLSLARMKEIYNVIDQS